MTSHPSSITTYGAPRMAVGRLEALPTTTSTLNSLLLRHVRSQRGGDLQGTICSGGCVSGCEAATSEGTVTSWCFKAEFLVGSGEWFSQQLIYNWITWKWLTGLFCKVEPFQSTTKQKSSWRMCSRTDRQSCNNLTKKEGKVKKNQTGWRAFFQETPFG